MICLRAYWYLVTMRYSGREGNFVEKLPPIAVVAEGVAPRCALALEVHQHGIIDPPTRPAVRDSLRNREAVEMLISGREATAQKVHSTLIE